MASHLAAIGLEKAYRKGKTVVPVLRGVDLEVERGELVAVVGASGSGKSTLLHVLGLLDAPDAGSVALDGRRIDDRPDRQRDALRNRTFGFIFQFYHLLPELSALENVMMPQMIRHGFWSYLGRPQDDPQARRRRCWSGWAWATGSTTARRSSPAARCSGPRSRGPWPAARRSSWPTSRPGTSTPATGQGVLELLRDLNRERGLTMMMVTHDIQIAQQADRVVRLAEGRIEEWAPALA